VCAATKDHREVQGEILEGLVVRLVSPRSVPQLRRVIQDYPLPHLPRPGKKERTLRDIYGDSNLTEKQVGRCSRRSQEAHGSCSGGLGLTVLHPLQDTKSFYSPGARKNEEKRAQFFPLPEKAYFVQVARLSFRGCRDIRAGLRLIAIGIAVQNDPGECFQLSCFGGLHPFLLATTSNMGLSTEVYKSVSNGCVDR
jgi:hypothetical protein